MHFVIPQVTEEVESKKDKEAGKGPSKDTGSVAEQQFVRAIIELHDKYLNYVSTCFCKVGNQSNGFAFSMGCFLWLERVGCVMCMMWMAVMLWVVRVSSGPLWSSFMSF